MPEVPRYGLPTVRPNAQLPYQRNEDMVGRALGQLGAAVGQVGDVIHEHQVRMRKEETETRVKAADADLQTFITKVGSDPESGYFGTRGEPAYAGRGVPLDAVRNHIKELQASLGPNAQKVFANIAAVRLNGFTENVFKHATVERNAWMKGVSSARVVASFQSAVASWNDDKEWERAVAVAGSEIRSQAAREGWGEDQIGVEIAKQVSAGMASRVERALSQSPEAGRALFERNKGLLAGDDLVKVERAVTNAVQNGDAQRDADRAISGDVVGAGTMPGFLARLGAQEGTGVPRLPGGARASSAEGHFQFLEGTWKRLVNSAEGRALGLTIEGRTDRSGKQQTAAMQQLEIPRYTKVLQAAGAPLSEKNLYMVHFMGAAGFAKMWKALQADPFESAAELFPEAAKANPTVFYDKAVTGTRIERSVLEVYNLQTRRFPGVAGSVAATGDTPNWEQMQANPAGVLARADALAEANRPGDIMYREKVRAAAVSTVAQHATSQANVRNAALKLVTDSISGGEYRSEAAFMANPENASAFGKLDPDMQRGIRYMLQFQATLDPQGNQIGRPPPVNVTIDSHNAKQLEAYDLGYKAMQNSWRNLPIEQQWKIGISYAAGAGVMPASLRGELVANLRNGDPARQVAAAELIARLAASNPALADDFSADETARAFSIRDMTQGGVQPVEAIRLADERARMPKDLREDRDRAFTAFVNEKRNGSGVMVAAVDGSIEDAFDQDGWFGGVRASTPGFENLRSTIIAAARAQYVAGNTMEASVKSAVIAARRTFGFTMINGDSVQIMRNAPESVYGIANRPAEYNSFWIKHQLVNDIIKAIPHAADPELLSQDPTAIQNINIRPAVGAVGADRRPWYQVFAGSNLLINKDGSPFLWRPDPGAEIARTNALQREANQEEIARARRIRTESGQGTASEFLGPGMGGF